MDVQMRATETIRPYEGNPRINDPAVDAVAASIQAFGFRQPVVIDASGLIIVGHTRWKAAKKLGLAEIPVHVADLAPDLARAYRIADNKSAEGSIWNLELLPIELAALREGGLDLEALGFTADELRGLLARPGTDGLTEPDVIPEPPEKATTRLGDLWILGNHRLFCGDSASAEDLDRLLAGTRIHLVNTDPPYNVNLAPRTNNAILAGAAGLPHDVGQSVESVQGYDVARHGAPRIVSRKLRARDRVLANDFLGDIEFYQRLVAWFFNLARVLEPGRAFFVCGGGST